MKNRRKFSIFISSTYEDLINAHTKEFAQAAGSDLGKMQALTGAKAMAMVALDVMGEKY